MVSSRLTRVQYFPVLLILLVAFSFTFKQAAAAKQTWNLPAPWSAQDIGSPAIRGSATFSEEVFTVTAGGSDIGGAADQFTYIYQQVSGDVDVIARVDSVSAANASSRSGVMIRSSLTSGSAHASAFVKAGGGVVYQSRAAAGGSTTSVSGPSVAAPYWVRLVRKGTTVTGYSSANGSSWSTISTQTIALGSTAYVGIPTTSRNTSASTTAAVSHVSVIPLSLPSPLRAADIGTPAIKGATTYSQGVFRVHAGGVDIWDTSDQFHFVYQPLNGDGEVIARVQSITNTDVWAKTGVMIRETLAPGSRHAFALITAGSGYAFQRRIDPSGISLHSAGPARTAPGWVRLVRTGSKIDAYQSTTGTTWTLMGSDAVPMASAVYVGIATTSHNTRVATDAVLDNFKVIQTGAPANQPPIVAMTSPADGSIFTVGTPITLNAAASDSDGTIARVDFYAGATKIGSDAAAPYSMTWSNAGAGTYSLSAVAVDNAGASTTAAAVGVRVDPATTQPPPSSLPTPLRAVDIGTPAIKGATTYSQGVFTVHAGGVDIWNTSDQFHFVYQPLNGDGQVIARVQSITNSDDWAKTGVMIRETLTANSRHAFATITAGSGYAFQRRLTTSGVSLHTAGPSRTAPGWVRLVRTGSKIDAYQSTTGTTWTLMGSDTVAMASAVYVGIATTSHDTSMATDAVVDNFKVIQSGSTTNQPPTVTLTAPANGTTYTAPATMSLAASASDVGGSVVKVEFYAGTTLLNTDSTAPYAFTWSSVAAGTYAIKAVAYDNQGASGTSATVSVTVGSTANKPPTVTLTAPANGTGFIAPATVSFTATASDSDGTIARVEFYSGTTLLNSDTTAPYAFSWSNVAAGTYSLRAVAYDNKGASTSSATNIIVVNTTTTTTAPRLVSFTASVDHATLVTRYELRIYTSGANPSSATPIATSDLGKPTPGVNNDITVDRSAFFSALKTGNYVAAVAAIGSGGSSLSAGVAFSR